MTPMLLSLYRFRHEFSILRRQLFEQLAKVRHLFAKHAVPCFRIPDFDTDDGTDDNDFFSCIDTKKCSEAIRNQQP